MTDIDRELPAGWFLRPCLECDHLGFSHDNAAECAECDCIQFEFEADE